jgi:ribonucleoside-diphosphate reductase alpha chain
VRSLPDGVAQALAEYLENSELGEADAPTEDQGVERDSGNGFNLLDENALASPDDAEMPSGAFGFKIGDLCPECGHAAVVNEEGCRKCYACGFSEC